jgi:hypothetical protein
MVWSNQPLVLYHGTDDASAKSILAEGVKLRFCNALTDFGRGFYTTTNLAQAWDWAALRAKRLQLVGNISAKAAVIRISAERNWLGRLDSLIFVRDARETRFPDFVRYCRKGGSPHRPRARNYKVVYGPVAEWNDQFDPNLQLSVFPFYDQISFHDMRLLKPKGRLLKGARRLRIQARSKTTTA